MSHTPLLTKSRYMIGRQCEKRLYLDVLERGLGIGPLPTAAQQAMLGRGVEVGKLARSRYRGGVLIDTSNMARALRLTQSAIDKRPPAIFEAAFEHAGVQVRVDVLQRFKDGWRLIEVKSSSSCKPEHIEDVGVQLYVLAGAGILVHDAGVLFLNGDYCRGMTLSRAELFTYESVLADALELQKDIPESIIRFARVLRSASEPAIQPGAHCKKPHPCPHTTYCIPDSSPLSVLRIPGGGDLVKKGIELVSDVDPGTLGPVQERARRALLEGKEQVEPDLGDALRTSTYPIYFLDFETFAPAIPRYEGTSPYQALPCQWSAHVLHQDDRMEHDEFLHIEDTDPRKAFVKSLLAAIGQEGAIYVYSGYEKTQLEGLAKGFPRYAARLRAVIGRLHDLLKIIERSYYHPAFAGSFSIKKVLPALTTTSYKDLAIQRGDEAQVAYERMIQLPAGYTEREGIATALLLYCKRDTRAMVDVRAALLARC